MNKIQVEDIKDEEINYVLEEDSIFIIKNSRAKINYFIKNSVKVFCLLESSNIDFVCSAENNFDFNIFSVNTTLNITSNLNKDNLKFKLVYSTINEKDNDYKVTVNHFGKNITSDIISHGINKATAHLTFIINAKVPMESTSTKTNQDSKIITIDKNTATIKPNLLVDTDDIEASHSAYIGEFKEEDLFYFETRGLNRKTAEKLLAKSFLIGQMNISFREKDMILEILKRYWR
ncbi:MAG: SufD family Fe-S cluster assembly protein [Bacilli bacterium]